MDSEKELFKKILFTYLAHQPGVALDPKADGRVEIPQAIIKGLGWNGHEFIFVHSYPGELVLSYIDKKYGEHSSTLGKIKVANGRVRIPVSFLRKSGFEAKQVMLSAGGDGALVVRPSRTQVLKYIKKFIDSLSDEMATGLASLLMGNPSSKVTRVINSSEIKTPLLFLPSEEKAFSFRPVGNPYGFRGYHLSTKELVLAPANSSALSGHNLLNREHLVQNYYLLPVIRRLNKMKDPGFLLVGEHLFGKIVKRVSPPFNYDVIIMKNEASRSFRTYSNPKEEISRNLVQLAINTCSKPESFLQKNFRPLGEKDLNNVIWRSYSSTPTELLNTQYES